MNASMLDVVKSLSERYHTSHISTLGRINGTLPLTEREGPRRKLSRGLQLGFEKDQSVDETNLLAEGKSPHSNLEAITSVSARP